MSEPELFEALVRPAEMAGPVVGYRLARRRPMLESGDTRMSRVQSESPFEINAA